MFERNSPSTEEPKAQDQLFGIGPGAYGSDIIRPIDYSQANGDTAAPAPATPEEIKSLNETTPGEMIEIALADRLEADIYGRLDPRRAEFLKKYHWTPYSKLEVTAAIGTDRYENPPLVSYLKGANRKGGVAAVRKVLDAIDKARGHATLDIETLRTAQDVHTGEFNPSAVKGNAYVLQVLANAIFARNSLNVFEWPDRYLKKSRPSKPNPNVEKKILGIFDKLSSLDNDTIKYLCDRTLRHQQARAKFLAEQSKAAEEHSDTIDIVTAARTNG